MKATIAAILITLSTTVCLAANHPWEDLVGCYTTIERNGYPVETPEEYEASTHISFEPKLLDGWIKDPSGKDVPGLQMFLFEKYEEAEGAFYFGYHPVLNEGTYSAKDNKRFHSVKKRLSITDENGRVTQFSFIAKTRIDRVSADQIKVFVQRTIPEVGDGSMDSNDTYLLRLDESQDCALVGGGKLTNFSPVSR